MKEFNQKYDASEKSKKQLQVKSQEEIDELRKECERLEKDLKSVLKKYEETQIPDLIEDVQPRKADCAKLISQESGISVKVDKETPPGSEQSVDQGIDTLTENLSQVQEVTRACL